MAWRGAGCDHLIWMLPLVVIPSNCIVLWAIFALNVRVLLADTPFCENNVQVFLCDFYPATMKMLIFG